MPCPSCATTKPLETHLDLNVGQPSVVKFEFIPASCLATMRPAYGEIFTPGAGRYQLSMEPYQPRGRSSSMGCGGCTIQMYEGSAGGASTPDTIRSKPRRISSSSISRLRQEHQHCARYAGATPQIQQFWRGTPTCLKSYVARFKEAFASNPN